MSVAKAQACGLLGCAGDPHAKVIVPGVGVRIVCEECFDPDRHEILGAIEDA